MDAKRWEKRNKLAAFALKSRRLSERFDAVWQKHCRMFGDILRPAFEDDPASRIMLASALELISRGRLADSVSRLEKLKEHCDTDADFVAWYFFVGVCCEKCGFTDGALMHYGRAARLEPEFYMVYLMTAKCLHTKRMYEAATGAYFMAMDKILSPPKKDEIPAVNQSLLLGSVHGNLANCFIMMRNFDDAEYELYEAERCGFSPPMLSLTWATLYAATGRRVQALEKMAELKKASPEMEASSILPVMEIIEQKNPRFAPRSIDTGKIARFWDWFCEHEKLLRDLADSAARPVAEKQIRDAVRELFDFCREHPDFEFGRDGEKTSLSFFANYNLSFELWLERLIELRPDKLKENWSFYATD